MTTTGWVNALYSFAIHSLRFPLHSARGGEFVVEIAVEKLDRSGCPSLPHNELRRSSQLSMRQGWDIRQFLGKVEKRNAIDSTLPSPLFLDHFLCVDSAPFDRDVFNSSTTSPNLFGSVLYRIKTAIVSWRFDN